MCKNKFVNITLKNNKFCVGRYTKVIVCRCFTQYDLLSSTVLFVCRYEVFVNVHSMANLHLCTHKQAVPTY